MSATNLLQLHYLIQALLGRNLIVKLCAYSSTDWFRSLAGLLLFRRLNEFCRHLRACEAKVEKPNRKKTKNKKKTRVIPDNGKDLHPRCHYAIMHADE